MTVSLMATQTGLMLCSSIQSSPSSPASSQPTENCATTT